MLQYCVAVQRNKPRTTVAAAFNTFPTEEVVEASDLTPGDGAFAAGAGAGAGDVGHGFAPLATVANFPACPASSRREASLADAMLAVQTGISAMAILLDHHKPCKLQCSAALM